MTRNRRADRETKIHNAAIRRALERKADREFVKANPDVLTEEEEIEDDKKSTDKEFFDICNEKGSKKDKKTKKPKKSKKSEKSEKSKKSEKSEKSKKSETSENPESFEKSENSEKSE